MIPQLTAETIEAIVKDEETYWCWLSEQVYAQACAMNPEHLLVLVGKRFNFAEIVKRCQGYRQYCGKDGQAARHSLGQLCRASVVKSLYNWSYETVSEEAGQQLLVRWFIGYGLHEKALSDTTLWHFEQWLKAQEPRLLFSELYQQIRQDFPVASQALQVGDTFAMQSVCREQSRTEMLREGCRTLLRRLAQVCPAAHSEVQQALDNKRLFGIEKELKEWWLDQSARNRLEVNTAYGALECVILVRQQEQSRRFAHLLEYEGVRHWLGLVEKVLNDEFELEGEGKEKTAKPNQPNCPAPPSASSQGEPKEPSQALMAAQVVAGVVVNLRHRQEHRKGSYALGSMKDREATFRLHGDKISFGYNINLAADQDFIAEINAVTGATPDASGVAALIANQKAFLGCVPAKLVYDRAVGKPFYFAAVDKASDGQTQLVARLIDSSKNARVFSPNAFALGEDGYLTCPNHLRTNRAYRAVGAEGWSFRFKADECKGCPLWDKCREAGSKATSHRTVFVSDYAHQQRQALAYTKTAEFQLDMQQRPAIERIIACLTRYNGGRQNKARGVVNADFQSRNSAIAYNLKHWCVLTLEKKAATRHTSPDDG